MELNSLPSVTIVESNDNVMLFNSKNGARKITKNNFFLNKLNYSSKTVAGSNPGFTIYTENQPSASLYYGNIAKVNRVRSFTLQIGNLNLAVGKNKIAKIASSDDYPAMGTTLYFVGTIGTDSTYGTSVRVEFSPNGDIYAISDVAVSNLTLRVSGCYIAVTE